MSVGKVSTKDNVSDLGTKRLSRDRMEYLMFLCKVYNMSDSSLIGSSVAERLDEQQAMKAGVKMFKQMGMSVSNSKGLMKILLLNALSVSVAMDSTMASPSPASDYVHGLWKLFFAFMCTLLCMVIGFLVVTEKYGAELQRRLRTFKVEIACRKILRILQRAGGDLRAAEAETGESETMTADPIVQSESDEGSPERERDKRERYLRCSMDEVSDDEFWRHLHHGRPADGDSPRDQRSYSDAELESMMRETNDVLRSRIRRLRQELEIAEAESNQPAMEAIESQIFEAQNLMYSI